MTLGEFKKLTAGLPDDAELLQAISFRMTF